MLSFSNLSTASLIYTPSLHDALPILPVALGWILLLDGKFGLLNQWLQTLPFVGGPIFNIYSYWGIVWVHMTTSLDRKSTRLNSSHRTISYAVFCLKKKKTER